MLVKVRKLIYVAAVVALTLGLFPRLVAYADATCSIVVSPDEFPPGASSVVQFDLENTGSDTINWIQVQRPSVSYSINGITQTGWTDATDDSGTVLTGGSLAPGDPYSLQLALSTGPQEESAADWLVQVSPNSDGSGAVLCSGSAATSITTPATPPSPNGESEIGLTNITPTSAIIGWVSDVPSTSYVYFGTTTAYGRIATVPSTTTIHSVPLTGLTPETIYHYKVAGTDDQGNSLFSGDNTFITPAAPPPIPSPTPLPSTPSSGGSNNAGPGQSSVPIVIPRVPGDTAAPTVTLGTSLAKPFPVAPEISGAAADNGALARIEYSVNDGLDWLPADKTTGLGSKAATYRFTPIITEDGNYKIVIRAIDSNGNQGRTEVATLVIDRLPPQLGPVVISYGPETLMPSDSGVVNLVAGTDYKVVTSAVGGPITAALEANLVGDTGTPVGTFALTQSTDSGLWNGLLSIKTGGSYQLSLRSLDGAGNRTFRQVMTLAVSPGGRVIENGSKKAITEAALTLFYLEPSTQAWQVWDGAPYGQSNPQRTGPDGQYSLTIPVGKYYLRVQTPLYRTYTSDIFDLSRPVGLTSIIALHPIPHLNVGPFNLRVPELAWKSEPLLVANFKSTTDVYASLVGKPLPEFNLVTTAGESKRNLNLLGRPTVLSVLTTWSPDGQDQLSALVAAQTNRDINVWPVFSQERGRLASTYIATAGYELKGIVDTDGILVPLLHVGSLPQHIFVDRTGIVKKITVGILSKAELLNQLGGL